MRVIKRTAALAATAVLTVVMAACGTAGQSGPTGPVETPESLASRTPEYNPQPYENIRDGGTLTTAIPEINPQFNVFQADMTADTRTVWNWYNPIFITFTPEGEAQFNPDYLTDVARGDRRRQHPDHLHDQPHGPVQRQHADRLACRSRRSGRPAMAGIRRTW